MGTAPPPPPPAPLPDDNGDVDPNVHPALERAYNVQQDVLRTIQRRFIDSQHNFKLLVREIILSPYFRAKNATPTDASLLNPRDIAVLYLEDLSPEGNLGHVADGLTEGLINELSRVSGLDVVSRNASAAFRGSTLPDDRIARALGVGTLIRG